MTLRKNSIRILVGLVALATLSSCATLEKQIKAPEVSISDARIVNMSLADVQLAFDFDVRNPNPIGLSMHGLSYDLAIQDRPLFHGTMTSRLQIGANKTSHLTLPFTLRYEDVLGTLLALRDNNELRYKISGQANLGIVKVPYSHAGSVSLPTLPDVSVQSLRISKLTLTGAELALGVKVNNANGFPVRFNGISYDLKLADASLLRGQSTQPLSVDAHGNGTLMLSMAVDYAQIGSVAQKLRSANSLPVELDSQVKVPGLKGDVVLPYRWKGDVPLVR